MKVDPEVGSLTHPERIRTVISVALGLNQQAANILTNVGATIKEYVSSINTYVVDLPLKAVETIVQNPAILFIRYAGDNDEYRNIIVGFDKVVEIVEKDNVKVSSRGAFEEKDPLALEIRNAIEKDIVVTDNRKYHNFRVVNLSLGPREPHPFEEGDPMNLMTKRAVEHGILVVVAAGNSGPKNNTLNPWSVAPWVIGVGAAVDEKTLSDYSSRGDPKDPRYCLSVVASGACLEGREGTSFAAPRVSSIACVCIEFIESLHDHVEYPTSSLVNGNQISAVVIDSPVDLAKMPRKKVLNLHVELIKSVVDPTTITFESPVDCVSRLRLLSHETREKLSKILTFLRNRGIPYSFEATPKILKKMITSMAVPIPGKMQHEIGAGFVGRETETNYLRAFGAKTFVQLFADRPVSKEDAVLLEDLDHELGPLVIEREIVHINRFFSVLGGGVGLVSVPIS